MARVTPEQAAGRAAADRAGGAEGEGRLMRVSFRDQLTGVGKPHYLMVKFDAAGGWLEVQGEAGSLTAEWDIDGADALVTVARGIVRQIRARYRIDRRRRPAR